MHLICGKWEDMDKLETVPEEQYVPEQKLNDMYEGIYIDDVYSEVQ